MASIRKASMLGLTLASVNFERALTCVFGLLCLFGILHHEMWRDELQAWNLARDSTSVYDLFKNMRTEGHPALWHLCLYAITRVSRNPLSMQLFHAAIATVNVFLFTTFSPFTQRQKVLAAFGYFSFYEYALISRGYALGVSLVFLFCSLYPWCQQQQHSSRPLVVWLSTLLPFFLLSLLANVSLYGMLLSVALSIALIWPLKNWVQTLVGTGLLGLGWVICHLQVSRIHVFAYESPGRIISSDLINSSPVDIFITLVSRLASTLSQVWDSYVPLPPFWEHHFWSRNFLSDQYALPLPLNLNLILPSLLSLLLIALVLKSLRHRPKWLAIYSVGTGAIFLFNYVMFGGYLRHHGHLFILLIACFWLSATDSTLQQSGQHSNRSSRQLQKRLLTGLLVCQMLGGMISYTADIARTFSGSQTAADFLRSQNLTHLEIFGYPTGSASTLAGYLDKPIYYPDHDEFGTFWRTSKGITPAQMHSEISPFANAQARPFIIATNRALETTTISGITLQPLTHVHSQIVNNESFYLYMATPITHQDIREAAFP